MITPKCDKCGQELKTYGALAFSPPKENGDGGCDRTVEKIHLCTECWSEFLAFLSS